MSRSGIVCRGVVKRYASPASSVEALGGVDATFRAGGLGVLVGPSGCGKSTLLRLLAGLDGADAGTIEVAGADVTALRGRALRSFRRDTVAYVAQRAADNLVPHLTIREHLASAADASLLDDLDLSSRLDARVAQLSGGEQARAALAIGLLRATPVLLVDEPTAELDRASAARVLSALGRAAAAGRTVVAATHDPDLVAAADDALHLERELSAERIRGRPGRRGGAPLLEVRRLTKSYRGTRAVDGASLALAAGELGVVLGRSGSGKSTLLMAVGGWLEPDAGAVLVGGREQDAAPPWSVCSYLAQRFGLLPELSIRENVGLPLRLAGERDEGRVAGLLDRLGLSDLADRAPAETSIGQQQRAALARALAQRPSLLLADEPSSHQDGGFAELVWQTLLTARDEGTACLVATHDPAAARCADRVWEIADGRIGRPATPLPAAARPS